MKHILIKLVSGEELVSECTEETSEAFLLLNPYAFMYASDQSGATGIKLIDFSYYADIKEFTIDKKHVIYYTYSVNNKLIEYYKNTLEANNKSFADTIKTLLNKLDFKTLH
jgi:hypothetical protein